ncbi:MAG: tetratricopeptide repeat protein [Alphaproteobacteria bacterium]|nr:tetratricopeptide repeat protein [Alphaproteobacteria bacterium]
MFPHDKLDWNLARLEKDLASGAPPDARLAFARGCLSKGRFHGGGDTWFNEALTQARRVLHKEPGHPEALVVAALALLLLDRAEPADRYLEEASKTAADNPMLWMALGERALQKGHGPDEVAEAIAAFERMVQLAPEAWESHMLLGHLLAGRVKGPSTPRREIEHAQYHLVRALQLEPSAEEHPALLHDLALLCLKAHRVADAQRLLTRLLDFDAWRAEARYHLGRVAARMGKHKKAILFFRQYLADLPDERADVWTRIGASYLHLAEPAHAREACNRALAIDDGDLDARWILGSALLTEGAVDDAVRVFREILELAPDHEDAFAELVRLRTADGDVRWLRQALRSETAVYDRLPAHAMRDDPRSGRRVPIDPRSSTRARIDVLLRGLGRVDPEVTGTVLACLDLTTDEGLRFRLWEGVLELLAKKRAGRVAADLAQPGEAYSAAAGRDVLTLAHLLPEDQLTAGLALQEEDLRHAAVSRHGPADDVVAHRRNIERERQEARAWQAMLLLAIASQRTPTARNLLVRWSSDADEELGLAARAGLAMLGDEEAVHDLRALASQHALDHLARRAVASTPIAGGPEPARLVSDRDDLVCATCGRRGSQVSHMVHGHGTSVCSVCMASIHERRDELRTREPEVQCALTGASLLDADAIYVYQGVPVSAACVDQSLGHDEREAIASYLAAL